MYTMGTSESASTGLCQLAAADIFTFISQNSSDALPPIKVRASFIHIYNEKVTDLLATSDQAKVGLVLKERDGRVSAEGMLSEWVDSADQLTALISAGQRRRAVAGTALNAVSSRSLPQPRRPHPRPRPSDRQRGRRQCGRADHLRPVEPG